MGAMRSHRWACFALLLGLAPIRGAAGQALPQAGTPPPAPPSAPPPATMPAIEPLQPPPAGTEQVTPFKLRLAVDIPLMLVGLTLWTVPYAILDPELPGPPCDPCDRQKVNPFDRLSIGLHTHAAATAADVMLYALPPIFFTIRMVDYGVTEWRGYLTDAVVVAETVVWSGVANELVRRIVQRPRPFMYEVGVYPDKRNDAEAALSYYSGHTAAAFAFAVATAYAYTLRHPRSKWRFAMWFGLLTYATVQGVLRVVSGDHFPTDVIFGAVVGSGIGVLVPTLHRRRGPDDRTTIASLNLVPARIDDGAMVSLVGTF